MRPSGPDTVPLASMPCRGLRAAGVVGGRPGGVASHHCEGLLVSGAAPPLASRPWGRATRAPLVVSPGRRCCGGVDPALAPQRAPLRAGVSCCGGGGRASPSWGFPRCREPAPGVRRQPSSGCPSVGQAVRARRSLAVGACVWAWV